ncbi:MAG: peptidoglycan DD-metalloendopeptidase family protein [Actinomycetota bacterium]
MTRSDRSFPVGPRLLALCVAIAAVAIAAPIAGAAPSSNQVDSAHAAAVAAERQLNAIQSEINTMQLQLADAVARVDQEETALEQVVAEIDATKARIAQAQARYDAIRAQLNQRAVQAFMSGPGSELEVFLGATSLGDLSDRLAYVDAVAQSDASLAQEVANLQAELEIEAQNLEQLRVQQRAKVISVRSLRDGIINALAGIQQRRDEAARIVSDTIATYQHLRSARADYLQQLAQQTSSSPPHTPVSLPPGFTNPLQVCPVDGTRVFGDGFGAPRYAGGFHLHAGVDIVSNYGTPILAPFDGIAKRSYNTLGGNSEYVYGASGYVYNAHLDHYSSNSDGSVQAGDVIGYVGDTGDAVGSPHDHFEWHPDSVPANWPVSYYGYAVIGSAVNPYPLLVDICG